MADDIRKGLRSLRPQAEIGLADPLGGGEMPGGPSLAGMFARAAAAAPKQLQLFPSLSHVRGLFDRADATLPPAAQEAITSFVGHGPGAKNRVSEGDFTGGFGLMNARPLEDALRGNDPHGILQGIEQSFAPVRAQLREEYGTSMPLLRVQRPVEPGQRVSGMPEDAQRHVLSWTGSPSFARSFSGALRDQPAFTERQIAEAEARHAATGETTIPGTRYTLRGLNEYTDLRGQPRTSIDIYDRGEHLTDTDSVRDFILSLNQDRAETAARNAEKLGRIVRARIPLDDVLYGTDRAGQTEFLVRNQPGQQVWIDPSGQVRSR